MEAENKEVLVVDKRTQLDKIWSKHRQLILISGAVLVAYYIYKKNKQAITE